MVEVNEEIVCKWLEEVKGFFVVTDIKYRVKGGWSDVDIIAHHPITGESWVLQVKGWHTETVYPYYAKSFKQLSPRALNAIRNKLGNRKFKRILVVPQLSENEKTRQRTFQEFKKKGMDDIVDFKTVLQELINTIDKHKSYDNRVLQTLRLLKIYKPEI